jgi:hypothetical protein
MAKMKNRKFPELEKMWRKQNSLCWRTENSLHVLAQALW